MPYSNVPEHLWEKMDRCVEDVMEKDGVNKERAIAICHRSVVGEKEKSISLSGVITKAHRMPDGRVKWRARVNSGQFDSEGERFDRSFFEEVVKNFAIQQEALHHKDTFPISVTLDDGFIIRMREPIQDISHYSYFLPDELRNKARTGYPTKLWLDGNALMSEGYYDNTPLGQMAAKAALEERDVEKRRQSIGVYPDWGLVEVLGDGRRVFKGGRGRAWLDHEAITSVPVDTDTEVITLSEVNDMTTQKEDAISVLGDDAEELIDELEKAKVKSKAGEEALLKGEEEGEGEKEEKEEKEEGKVEEEAEDKAEGETEAKDEAETEAETESESDPDSDPEPAAEAAKAAVKAIMQDFIPAFGQELVKRVDQSVKAQVGDRLDQIEADLAAVKAGETEKVQAALDNPDDWIANLAEKSLSVQHGSEAVVKGEKAEETPSSDFAKSWGNPE